MALEESILFYFVRPPRVDKSLPHKCNQEISNVSKLCITTYRYHKLQKAISVNMEFTKSKEIVIETNIIMIPLEVQV